MRKFVSEEGLEENQLQAEAISPLKDLPDTGLRVGIVSPGLCPGKTLEVILDVVECACTGEAEAKRNTKSLRSVCAT